MLTAYFHFCDVCGISMFPKTPVSLHFTCKHFNFDFFFFCSDGLLFIFVYCIWPEATQNIFCYVQTMTMKILNRERKITYGHFKEAQNPDT